MDFEAHLRQKLDDAAAANLLRTPEVYEQSGPVVRVAGAALVSFASNDYLGLANHPRLLRRLAEASLAQAGAGASRVVTGTTPAHAAAEEALASFVGLRQTRVFSSAFAANVGVLGSLFGDRDLILSDSLNHASLIDGCRLSRARVVVYRHNDLDHLRHLLHLHRRDARLAVVVSETAFSMDGDVTDVAALHTVARDNGAALFLDEAHALGVMGPNGRGVCADVNVIPDVLVGGLGKAFGLAGGFVGGSAALCAAIDNFSRSFVFSTAILPAIAMAVPTAVELLLQANLERARLQVYARALRETTVRAGARTLGSEPGVILPIVVGEADAALQASRQLRRLGLHVPPMRPPTVAPGTARLRVTPTAAHSPEQIEMLGEALLAVLSSPRGDDNRDQRDHA